jgi:hypothetical protein
MTDEDWSIRSEYEKSALTLLSPLSLDLYRLKTQAFAEEKEWRIISLSINGNSYSAFRALGDRIVPYRELELPNLDIRAIDEVLSGPRNKTPIEFVRYLLNQHGFQEVPVHRSKASYR